jgi:hypothetical protein
MMKSLKLKNPIKFSSGSGENNNSKPLKSFFANRQSKTDIALKKKKFTGNMKASSISPSVEGFDSMMSKMSKSFKPKKLTLSKKF